MDSLEALISRMDGLLALLEERRDPRRHFLASYKRTTIAVAADLQGGGFQDAEWVERWDIIFANFYLDALDEWEEKGTAPGPWDIAFRIARDEHLPPLRHTLIGINAHINYDLPQALLAMITDEEFADPKLVARRHHDHAHIDDILLSRVKAEDDALLAVEEPGDRTWLDRLLTPFNRAGTRRSLKEARGKVWSNAQLMSQARRIGPDALNARLIELAKLSSDRVADLSAPGMVLLKLAVNGFGVELTA